MANLLKTAQNTSKLGAVLNSGLYEKPGINWLIEKGDFWYVDISMSYIPNAF